MNSILVIAHLTLFEARRKKIVVAALAGGLLFLTVFGTGIYFAFNQLTGSTEPNGALNAQSLGEDFIRGGATSVIMMLGLLAVHFLVAAASVLLSIDTVSGEVASGVIETLVSKPVSRAQVILGKWFGYWLLAIGYLLLMVGGLCGIVYVITGFVQPDLWRAVPLMALEATVLLTVSIAGGTRLSTITNGIVCFAFFGVAVAAGIVEQVGIFLGNQPARNIGTAVSLVAPSDTIWRMAWYYLQPPLLRALGTDGPPIFWNASTPTPAMAIWAIGFVGVVLLWSIRGFNRRPL